VTLDIDIVVPDVLEAVEFLTADLNGPLVRNPGCEDSVRDSLNGILVNLLPAGRVLKPGCQVPFPIPEKVSTRPTHVSLVDLISMKLDSWIHSPARRLKDKADVIELIVRGQLPRDLSVQPAVRQLYEETWDALKTEK
jgi:hypothetical protein